jgi:uncharacterized protein YyaL (SSP411 family)
MVRCRLVAFAVVVGLVLAAGCERRKSAGQAGFEREARLTFQEDNPYDARSGVDWKPWSAEVLAGGDATRPVLLFLSGLWCHWCHLWEDGVGGNEELARFIRTNFVPVKVDADERPDIDARYNRGGWPSFAVLTPAGDVVAGTGYEVENLRAFLESALSTYRAGGDTLRAQLRLLVEQRARVQPFEAENCDIDAAALSRVLTGVKPYLDMRYGGFVPPAEHAGKVVVLGALLDLMNANDQQPQPDEQIEAFLRLTLSAMANGAIHDQLFGGFFRSVTDRAWSVPHFEKLLEVQAEIVDLYLAAARRYGSDEFRRVARGTIDFVMEFLANPDSVTFANATDPDLGPGDDGGFYTWTELEVDSLLSIEEARAVKLFYGIGKSGEIETEPGANTLYVAYSPSELAGRIGLSESGAAALLEEARTRMRAYRLDGPRPRVDSRAFSGPNLRFASALLTASVELETPAYAEQAVRTIDFFTGKLLQGSDGVPHAWDGRTARDPLLLRDQVIGIEANLKAYSVTSDPRFLERARELHRLCRSSFRNEVTGAYWDVPTWATGPGSLNLKLRPIRENTRLAQCAMDLFVAAADGAFRKEATQILKAFCGSYGARGVDAIGYAAAVHRLSWNLPNEPS